MDVDLQGMRAFVVTAEELHFGRAAVRLFLTQQALSKRIRRLEDALSVSLFARTTRKVELTPTGQRFLPLAREALEAFDAAVGVVRETAGSLRIDVYDERFTPMGIVRATLDRDPGLRIELSMRQGLAIALPAVQSGELDAAFGRIHDLQRPWPAELAHRLVHVEPIHAFVGEDHPLATWRALSLPDLRAAGIVMPDPGGAVEWRGYMTRFADRFGIPLRLVEPALGFHHFGELIRREETAVALGEVSIRLPVGSGLRRIPIVDPTPLYPWSVVWHRRNRSPQLGRLLRLLPASALPALDDDGQWVPDADRSPVEAGHLPRG